MSDNKIGSFLQNIFGFDNYSNEQQNSKTNSPTSKQTPPAEDEYIVRRGDTLTEIAVKTGQNLQELIKENPQIKNPNKIYIGQHIKTSGQTNDYTVKRGDTLNEIAKDQKVSVGDILRANPGQIANRNLIYPGQKLHLPVHAGETPASKPPTTTQTTELPKTETKTPPTKPQVPSEKPTETAKQPTPTQNTTPQNQPPNAETKTELKLGVNEKYKSDLLFAQQRTGTDASAIAGLINAEAAKNPKTGEWRADSYNPDSKAGGLTQFLPGTWKEMATTKGTYLNQVATEKGYVKEVNGKFVVTNNEALQNLRYNSRLAIVSAAEYDKGVLASAEKLGYVPKNLSSDERARYLYYAHHEGPGGLLTQLVDSKTATEEQAKAILEKRLGKTVAAGNAGKFGSYKAAYTAFAEVKARKIFPVQFGKDKTVMYKYVKQHGSYEQGYRAWLKDYTAQKVRPENYRQSSSANNTSKPPVEKSPQEETVKTPPSSSNVNKTKMPNTQGMTESQKYDIYSNYVTQNGNAKAKSDLSSGRRVIVGLRQPTNTHANNGNGAYDDRVIVLWKDADGTKHTKEILNANTEPASHYEDTPENRADPKRRGKITRVDANGDGRGDLGRLTAGTHEYQKSYAANFGTLQERGYNILRPTNSNTVERDSTHDGNFDGRDAGQNKRNLTDGASMYFHRGGRGGFTGSAGCQTMPQNDFNDFWKSLGNQKTFQYVLVEVGK